MCIRDSLFGGDLENAVQGYRQAPIQGQNPNIMDQAVVDELIRIEPPAQTRLLSLIHI